VSPRFPYDVVACILEYTHTGQVTITILYFGSHLEAVFEGEVEVGQERSRRVFRPLTDNPEDMLSTVRTVSEDS
jgi:hypothetical protein